MEVPTISMVSPSLRGTDSSPMASPLSCGCSSPSICARTKPWWRLVMLATATPGLPMVVTTLTSDTWRPAAAPERTLMSACRGGMAPSGAGRELGTLGRAMPGLNSRVFS